MTWEAASTGKRGRQPNYSDAAIQTCLTMKVLFGMARRQTTAFVESLLQMIGLDWAVPDFSTLSLRQKTLQGFGNCILHCRQGQTPAPHACGKVDRSERRV
jgi:Transposase DDE domain